MERRVIFGRRGLTLGSAPPAPPAMAARAVRLEEPPLRRASYEYEDGPFLASLGHERWRLLALLFSARGRMGRTPYCIVSLVSAAAYVLVLIALRLKFRPIAASLIVLPLTCAVVWSCTAIGIKRWHDRDKSGWWCLLGLVPVAGWVWSLVECLYLPGTRGPNRFGDDPRREIHLGEASS